MAEQREIKYAEILSRLIRIETISVAGQTERSNFYAFHEELKAIFPALFACVEVACMDGSLLLKWQGKDSSLSPILLMNHHDVVEASGEWKYPPFAGTVAEGKVWGRGALDNKGGLAMMLQAAEELVAEGYVPERDIYFVSTCTEETDGQGGKAIATYLQERGLHFDLILDEGGMILYDPIGGADGTFAMIGVGEKGYVDLKFTASSHGGHASAPGKDTPLVRLGKFMAAAEKTKLFDAKLSPAVKEMLSRFAPTMKGIMKLACGHVRLFGPILKKIMPAISPTAGAMLKTTLAFTMAGGSEGSNVLPEEAWVVANLRYSHHQGKASSLAAVEALAKQYNISMAIIDDGGESSLTDFREKGFCFLEMAVKEVFPGYIPVPYVMTAASDCRYYGRLSKNCLRFVPFVIDEQQLDSIHGKNECVDFSALPGAVDFYRYVLKEWH